uniref:Uncharacterized protein n=1 Tax=Trichobilharzia regenti TaxID=157069 RepID=A0AA85JVN4_TRIRE|nr:unnamed protein product [Trichobilharzia regenti]
MSSSNTDPVPDCSAQPGDVHEYYVKEVEKYSRLRSLEDKENEEASLALAAQLLYEDGCSLTDDIPISDEHVDSCHHINNDRYPVLSSSKVRSVAAEHKKKQGNKAPKICKTLLDYAVDTLSAETEPEEQILRDEKFARQLQAQYSRLSDKPIKQTRSRRRK